MRSLLTVFLAALVGLAAPSIDGRLAPYASHAPGPDLSVDTNSSGNSANSLGPIEACRNEPSAASSFAVDVVIQNVQSLSGYESDFFYDPTVLTITGKQTNFIMTPGPPPGFIDFSDPVPDSDGNYHILLATTGQGTGSGVIIRLTLQPGGDGTSLLDLANVKMRDYDNQPVQPADAQTFFVGDINDGVVMIGPGNCSDYDGDGDPNETDPDDDNDGVFDDAEAACGGSTPSSRRPERLDGPFAGVDDDGDTAVDEPLQPGSQIVDCDGDGWPGDQENFIYDDAPSTARDQDPCGNNGWPADLVDNNALNIADINSFLSPPRAVADYGSGGAFNTFGHNLDDDGDTVIESAEDPGEPGGPTYNVARWNLQNPPHSGTTAINIGDLNALITGPAGTPARPPMFGGQQAFFTNTGNCPWPP
jgi:hypothetical protein